MAILTPESTGGLVAAQDQGQTGGGGTYQEPLLDPKTIIGQTLAFLHPGGETFEICIIGPKQTNSPLWDGRAFGKKAIVAGWFKDPDKAVALAAQVRATGVYVTLNPCQDALLARANERLVAGVGRTKDTEILHIRNLLVDLDPIRPEGISSTDAGHEAALEMAQVIMADLTSEGWPEPLYGDSGNGAHLLLPVDLPNNPESIAVVKAFLVAMASRYADQLAERDLALDTGVFNPARLTKLYGTMACKGDSTPDRPHRLARIISLPEARRIVPVELLERIAECTISQESPRTKAHEQAGGNFDVEGYLNRYGREVVKVKPHGDATLYCLTECIFDPAHSGGEAAIGQTTEGKLFYQCFHDSCQGRTWAEARVLISGTDKLTQFISGHSAGYEPDGRGGPTRGAAPLQQDERQKTPWGVAAHLFPRIPFPWEVLPSDIADSLQQLGRACATSSTALPGAAFCLMSSLIGRSRAVSPKDGWDAPLIIWHMDIRESGDGKTPPVRLMAEPIHEAQKEEEKRSEEEMEAYRQLSKNNRDKQPPPAPPRGYFVTDLTLEGLREDLVHSPHGGIVVIQDEISAFLSGQNQYKSKGTDREAWLALHDGHPARIRRVGRSLYINGARVSIFGGIQPKVFRTFFAGEEGLYLSDGTLFRFLITCEPPTYYDLTLESWGGRDREKWETLLYRAIDWVEGEICARGGQIEKPARMILDSDAQGKFLEWRNQIQSFKDRLPLQLRGFLPKAYDYCLRLTGIIHCIQMFSQGGVPGTVLSLEDLERGLKAVGFYMGQIQGALRLIEEDDYSPPEISERSLLLAQTLEQLRSHLQDGRLAIGFIHKQYNMIAPQTQRIGKPRGMGAVLRAVNLTISPGKHNANGHRAAKCLEWDRKTEEFIEQRLQRLQQDEKKEWQELDDADVENSMPATSAPSTEPGSSAQTLQTSKEGCLPQETCAGSGLKDNADIADVAVNIPDRNYACESEATGAENLTLEEDDLQQFADTDELNLSVGINGIDSGAPDAAAPGESGIDGQDLIQCGWCQHDIPSPIKPGMMSSCHLYPRSGISQMMRFPDELHSCPSFEAKDSIKALAAWDEAISQMVGEALKLGNNPDFKEVDF